MKKRLPANVRFVKCPKCSKVLPEPSDVPIYMCGGCDTILQAKYYIKDSSNDYDQGGESSGSSPQSILSAQHSPDPSREEQNGYLEQAGLSDTRGASSSNGHCIADTQDSSSHGQTEEGKRYGEQCIDGEYTLRSDADSLKKYEEVTEPAPNIEGVGRGEKLGEEQPRARSCSKETSELDASSIVPLSNDKVSPIETQDSSSNLTNEYGKMKEEKQCVYGEGPLSSDANSLGKHEKESEPAPNVEDVRRGEKLSVKQPGAGSCIIETSESDASSTVPLSNDKISPIEARDSSSNFADEYGKMKEEKQCVHGEDPLSNDAKSLAKHEKTLEPSPDIEDVRRGEKLGEEQTGTRSCSRGTAESDELFTVASSNDEVSSTGDVEPEREQNVAAKRGFEQLGPDTNEIEVSSPDESCVPEINKSLPSATTVYQGEVDIAANIGSLNFEVSTSLKKSTLPQCIEVSGLPLENQEMVKRIGKQGVNLDPSTTSDELSAHENKDFSKTLVENHKFDMEQTQCRPTETKDEKLERNNRTEFISSTVSSHQRDESSCVASGEGIHSEDGRNHYQVADDARKLMYNMSITVISANPDRNEKDAAPEPQEANAITSKTHTVPLPSSNTLVENEKLSKVDFVEVKILSTELSKAVGDASRPNILGFNQKTVPNGLDSETSTKKLESPDIVNVKPDIIHSPNFFPRSPTRNSLAYDGSVSSCDGNDDQNLQMDIEILEKISEVKDQVTAEIERCDHFSVIPPDHQNQCSSSIQHNMPRSMFNNSQNLEGDRRSSAFRRNRMRHRTEGYLPSGYSSYLMSSEMAYESSVSSNLMHDEFHSHSNYRLPPHYSRGTETRTMRRHLHGSDVEGRMPSNSSWVKEGVSHPYCKSACEMYPPPRYPRYHYAELRKTEAQFPLSSNVRMPYSGEVLRSGYQQLYDPYLHRHPTSETRWSSHLPSPRSYYSRGWNSLRSGKPLEFYPPSPHFIDSDSYRQGYNSLSDDAGQNDQMVLNRLERRKKQLSGQRHFRPVAGGAPFVTCYECSALLQLPSDFLLFESRRILRLKCTSCSNILKFHLEKGIHLVPYTQRASATPDNEANEGENSRSLHLLSTSQQTNNNNRQTPQRRASSMNRSGVQDAAEGTRRDFSGVHERQSSRLAGQNSQNKGKGAMVESGMEQALHLPTTSPH